MLHILIMGTLLAQSWAPGPDGIMVPDIPLFNQQPEPFVAPGRLFSVKVPPGWSVALHKNDPNTVEFRGAGRPGNAVLLVRRVRVPRGAHPRQLVLNALERRLRKLPNFELAKRRDVQIAGNRAASAVGTYSYQGNLQFPVAIEEVHVVVGEEAFIFHFECFAPAASALASDVNQFYSSFEPRPPGLEDGPFAVPNSSSENVNPDNIRF